MEEWGGLGWARAGLGRRGGSGGDCWSGAGGGDRLRGTRKIRPSDVRSITSWAYPVPFITFISPPPGEAPDEVRRAWVGVTVPVTTDEARLLDSIPVVGVRSGPHGFWRQLLAVVTRRAETWRGYAIESRKCIEHLRNHDPAAASWWVEHAPRYLEPRRSFVFPAECCELSRAGRMPNKA